LPLANLIFLKTHPLLANLKSKKHKTPKTKSKHLTSGESVKKKETNNTHQ